tara:strand:+ start:22 stop:222 length:201 start_codon:yes stop_codon:yes gene_type:complete
MSHQDSSYAAYIGEGNTGNLPQFPATLNHGIAAVNTSISWYMKVLAPLSRITTAERICAGSLAEKL